MLVVLSLSYLKHEARGAHEPPPSLGGTAVLEEPAAGDGASHDIEAAGSFRNFHLRDAQGSTAYAWPCGLLVLFTVVLVYSTPAVRRPFPSRTGHNRAVRWPETQGQNGRSFTYGSERSRRPSLET